MKKYFLFLSLVVGISINAQIKVMSVPEKVEEKKPFVPYDSLTNMVRINKSFEHLIGQRVYYACENLHTAWFYKHPLEPNSTKKRKKSSKQEAPEFIPLRDMVGKYFTILKVEKSYDNKMQDVLYLKQDSLVNMITYKVNESAEIDDGWIVVGHFEKIKSLYEGKEFVFTGNIYRNKYGSQNFEPLEQGKQVDQLLKAGSLWQCKEVSVGQKEDYMVLGQNNLLIMIMKNRELGDYYCCYNNRYTTFCGDKKSMFLLVSDYEKMKAEEAIKKEKRRIELIEMYGEVNAKYILMNEVRIGMTTSMCREALGSPDKRNRTTGSYGTHEQWVYEKGYYKYLYFQNGELTSIQN